MIDKAEYGLWDNNDILYTTLGGLVSGLVLDGLLNKRKRYNKKRGCMCMSYNTINIYKKRIVPFMIFENSSRDLTAMIQAHALNL